MSAQKYAVVFNKFKRTNYISFWKKREKELKKSKNKANLKYLY